LKVADRREPVLRGGNYHFNGTQSFFTAPVCWGSHDGLVNMRITWCGASPGNTIGVNFTVTYTYPVCDPTPPYICDAFEQSISYYIRISVSPSGQYHWWSG
jgi:hypothetical protein